MHFDAVDIIGMEHDVFMSIFRSDRHIRRINTYSIVVSLMKFYYFIMLLYEICIAHKFKQARVRGAGVARSGSQRVEREQLGF